MAGSQVRIATITARCSFILDACRRPMRLVRSDHSRSPSAVLLDGDRPSSRRQQPTSVMMRTSCRNRSVIPRAVAAPSHLHDINRNEERVAEGTSGSGPSRPVGNKLTQVASAGRHTLGRVSGGGKKPGKGRKQSKAERSKDAASGRKRRFFNYPRAGKGKIHRWICLLYTSDAADE